MLIIVLLHQTAFHYASTGQSTLVSRAYDAYLAKFLLVVKKQK